MEELFGEVISSYTAEQAVEDGILVNVPEDLSRDAGFKVPIRITCAVHDLCTPPKSNVVQSYTGRLWDVLWMARWGINQHIKQKKRGRIVEFYVRIGRENERLWVCPDGTSGEALHVLKPEEY